MNLEESQVSSQVMFYEFVAFILLQVSELQIAHRLQEDICVFIDLAPLFKIVLWVGCLSAWAPKFLFSRFGKGIMNNSINSPVINWKELDPNSTLAWKIPWTEEPRRLQSMGLLRVGHDWATSLSLFTFMHWRRKWQPTPVFLPGESQGRGSLVGCRLWGRTESDTTEAT